MGRIRVYGEPVDMAVMADTADIRYIPVPGFAFQDGAIAWWCAAHKGKVVYGQLNAVGNYVTASFADNHIYVFDPRELTWSTVIVETDLGFTFADGVASPSNPNFGGGGQADLCVTDGRVYMTFPVDYRQWEIAVFGKYPILLAMNEDITDVDYDRAWSTEALKALVAEGDPDDIFPDAVNLFYSETYSANNLFNEMDVFPNGWMIMGFYGLFGGTSGAFIVIDPEGVTRGFYPYPVATLVNGELLRVSPRDIKADPSHTDPEDMRFTMIPDMTLNSDGSRPPFFVQEFSFNATTGVIAPVCAPIYPTTFDQDDDTINDYDGNAVMVEIDDEGTVWLATSIRQTFQGRAMHAWAADPDTGERRWATEAPPDAGWEDVVGSAWVPPDFTFDRRSGSDLGGAFLRRAGSKRISLVGSGGRVVTWTPDSPLDARPSRISDPSFTQGIAAWLPFFASSIIYWDGSGAMLQQTVGSTQSVIHFGESTTDGMRVKRSQWGQCAMGWLKYRALNYLNLPGATGDMVTTPDHASLDITGDIDLRWDGSLVDWSNPLIFQTLIGKWNVLGSSGSYRLAINQSGQIQFSWKDAGGTQRSATATASIDTVISNLRRIRIKGTLDVDDGAGGHVVRLWTSTNFEGHVKDLPDADWTQFEGDKNAGAFTTSIISANSMLVIGGVQGTGNHAVGKCYGASVMNGIGGTVVADPDFTVEDTGTASFADDAGRTWTMAGNAAIDVVPRRVRAELSCFEADGSGLGTNEGGGIWEIENGPTVKAMCGMTIPEGTAFVKLWGRVLDDTQPSGEFHVIEEAYLALAPATFEDDLQINPGALPDDVATAHWMTKGSVDANSKGWLAVRKFPPNNNGQPLPMSQYLVSVDMGDTYSPRKASSVDQRGPTDRLRGARL